MAELLDAQQVAAALADLPDWSGDGSRIVRAVSLPGRMDLLLERVQASADAMNHHPDVTREEDTAAFTVWTHSAGGVTDLDIALARRIDELVGELTAAE